MLGRFFPNFVQRLGGNTKSNRRTRERKVVAPNFIPPPPVVANVELWKEALEQYYDTYSDYGKVTLLQDLFIFSLYDPHLRAVYNKRIEFIKNKKYILTDSEGNEKDFDLVKTRIFNQIIELVAQSIFFGFTILDFRVREGKITDVCSVKRQHIDELNRRIIVDTTIPSEGGFLSSSMDKRLDVRIALSRAKANNLNSDQYIMWDSYPEQFLYARISEGPGVLAPASMVALAKRPGIYAWLRTIEKFGAPLLIFGEGGHGGDENNLSEFVRKVAEEPGHSGTLLVPDIENVKVERTVTSETTEIYATFVRTLNAELSKIVLGQTMTTEDGSSRSQAEIHREIENSIIVGDCREILFFLNNEFKEFLRMWDYDINDTDRFSIVPSEDPSEKIKIDGELLKYGVFLEKDYLEKTYNVKIDERYGQMLAMGPQEMNPPTLGNKGGDPR